MLVIGLGPGLGPGLDPCLVPGLGLSLGSKQCPLLGSSLISNPCQGPGPVFESKRIYFLKKEEKLGMGMLFGGGGVPNPIFFFQKSFS